jgi:hypothetical protein
MSGSSYFFSRGSISSPNTRFHMVGLLKKGTETSKLPSTIISSSALPNDGTHTTKDVMFLLCLNHYKDSRGNEKQRIYWSCDPTDFIINYNDNSQNQGPVKLVFTGKSGTDFNQMKILTSKNMNVYSYYNHFDNNLTDSPHDIQLNNVSPSSFQVTQNDYNLPNNQIFLSIPYSIKTSNQVSNINSTLLKYKWSFRKILNNTHSDADGLKTIHANNSTGTGYNKDTINLFSNGSLLPEPFKNLNVPVIKFTSNLFNVTQTTDSVTNERYYSIPKASGSKGWENEEDRFDLMARSNGIIKFIDNGDTTKFIIINYNKKVIDSSKNIRFYTSSTEETKFYGSTGITSINTGVNCTITYELRNDPFGFGEITSDDNEVSDWMDFYFIPSETSAIFPSGFSLEKHEFYTLDKLVPGNTFTIYNPAEGNKTTGTVDSDENSSFDQFFYREFSTFFILKVLNGLPSYWTTNSEPAFPKIAINPINNGNTSSTIFTWSTLSLAHYDYMFDYCNNNETCGFCYGNGLTSKLCVTHNDSKKVAVNYSLGNTDNPVFLTNSNENEDQDLETDKDKFWVLVIIMVILFIILFVTIMVRSFAHIGNKVEKQESGTGTEKKPNP